MIALRRPMRSVGRLLQEAPGFDQAAPDATDLHELSDGVLAGDVHGDLALGNGRATTPFRAGSAS